MNLHTEAIIWEFGGKQSTFKLKAALQGIFGG